MGDDTLALGAVRVDEGKLKGHVDEVVRSSVEETLNALLNAEADEICRAQRYRALSVSGGYPGRTLQAQARDEGRPGEPEDPEASAPAV